MTFSVYIQPKLSSGLSSELQSPPRHNHILIILDKSLNAQPLMQNEEKETRSSSTLAPKSTDGLLGRAMKRCREILPFFPSFEPRADGIFSPAPFTLSKLLVDNSLVKHIRIQGFCAHMANYRTDTATANLF